MDTFLLFCFSMVTWSVHFYFTLFVWCNVLIHSVAPLLHWYWNCSSVSEVTLEYMSKIDHDVTRVKRLQTRTACMYIRIIFHFAIFVLASPAIGGSHWHCIGLEPVLEPRHCLNCWIAPGRIYYWKTRNTFSVFKHSLQNMCAKMPLVYS